MSCSGCKGAKTPSVQETVDLSARVQLKNYIIKTIIFLVMVLLSPIVLIGIYVVLFKSIVLSKHVDIIPALRHLMQKWGKNNDDEDEDDDDEIELNEDDYELTNVEVIKDTK
jgi:hypothetical protein